MKVVILCGGMGTRLSEETKVIPKPMVKIGKKPILCHIIDIFKYYGINEFLIAAGYKKEKIIKFFTKNKFYKNIQVIDTGQKTLTGGRLLRLKDRLINEKFFFMTYGDGLSDINIRKLLNFHKSHNKIATVSAVHPPVRFGELEIKKEKVIKFEEKPQSKVGWINGGFFVLNSKIFDFIKNDQTVFEREPVINLTKRGEIMAFKHKNFWQCMDTIRDKKLLNKLWNENRAPWKK